MKNLKNKFAKISIGLLVLIFAVTAFAFIACEDETEPPPPPEPVAPTITTASLPGGYVGEAYSQTLTATGTTPITWSYDVENGALPDGLTLSPGGLISGIPTTVESPTFTVKATNSIGSDTKELSINIAIHDVTFTLGVDGSATQTTSQLTLTFSEAIIGLSADNITLSGVTGVTKGTLSSSGLSYTLPISGFTAGGTLSVSVEKQGYSIDSPKTIFIYVPVVWTAISDTNLTNNIIHDIAWGGPAGNQKFVVLLNSSVTTSTDGVTWSSQYDVKIGNSNGIAWGGPAGNQKFVAVGKSGVTTSTPKAMYSTDGVNWTDPNVTFDIYYELGGIIWGGPAGNQKFVAWGGALSYLSSGKAAYSPDGVTWTVVSDTTFSQVYGDDIKDIAWGGPAGEEKFVAVGIKGKTAYSSDGVTWIAGESNILGTYSEFSSSKIINGIAWGGPAGNQKFVAVGYYGKVAYSANGVNWTVVDLKTIFGTGGTNGSFPGGINGIAWGGPAGNEKFVAVGDYGKAAYSPDGVNWTAVADTKLSDANNYINSIVWGGPTGNQKFIAVGNTNSSIKNIAAYWDGN